MGYRSSVGIVIYTEKETYNELLVYIGIQNPSLFKFLNERFVEHTFTVQPQYIEMVNVILDEDYIKWGTEESELFNLLDELEEINIGLFERISAGFVRVGEETGDIETRYINDGYELIYPTTSIEFNI